MAYVARIIPLIIIVQTIPIVLADFPGLLGPVKKAADVYLVFLWLWIIRALLRSIRDYLRTKESFKDKRSEEHTSELQSLMRISYAVFCLKKKTTHNDKIQQTNENNIHRLMQKK